MRRVAASSTTPNLELPKMNRKNAILATALGGLLALNVATQAQAAKDAKALEDKMRHDIEDAQQASKRQVDELLNLATDKRLHLGQV